MTTKELDEKVLVAYSAFLEMQIDKSKDLCSIALEECLKHDYHRGIGGCHYLSSNIFSRSKEWYKALKAAEKALLHFEKIEDRLFLAHTEFRIAYFYSRLEENIIAFEQCKKALIEFQALDDKRGEAEAYSLLGTMYIDKAEYEIALEYLQRSFNLKILQNNLDPAGSDCINIAAIYLYKSENERAIGYLRQAIELKERYKKEFESESESVGLIFYSYNGYVLSHAPNDRTIADAYLNLGMALSGRGDYIEAVDALDKALKIKQDLGDQYGEAVVYNQIGNIFIEINDLTKAEWYFLNARPLFEMLGHKQSEGTVWYNLGRIYLLSERWEAAHHSLEKAEKLFIGLDIPYDELCIMQQKAALATKVGKFVLAEQLISQGLEMSRRIKAREFEVDFLLQLAGVQDLSEDFSKAIRIYLEALEIAKDQELLPKIAKILQTISGFHKKTDNYRESLRYFEEFHTVQEKIIHAQAARHLNGMQVLHEIEIHRKNEDIARSQIAHLESLIKISNQSILLYKKEFNTLKSEILAITSQKDKEENLIRKIKMKLRESPVMQETWESYLEIFSKVHPDFQVTLVNKYQSLTTMEIKVCVLIRAGLMSDEIAQILSLSERTIENKRLQIRKKVGLGERGSLSGLLRQL